MLILSAQDLSSVLSMREVIDAVEEGFRALARADVRAPERLHLEMPEAHAVLLAMPAEARALRIPYPAGGERPARRALGTKIASVFEENVERGLDRVQAVYLLLDGTTGAPLALMEGRWITAMRTAATSAVATKYLAAPGAKRLAIFGAGVQAQVHIDAMLAIAPVTCIRIRSRSEDKARALAERTRARWGIPCDVVAAEVAAATADLICTCTNSPQPLFDGRCLAPGTHINAVGAFTPSTRELDTETVRRARVIVDADSAAGLAAGEIRIPLAKGAITADHIRGTLADVVSGKVAGLAAPDAITLFKSCGLAIEDLVTAQLAYEKALAQGVGCQVAL